MNQPEPERDRLAEFASLYEPLREHAIMAHANWQVWLALFSTGEERVDMLNRSASSFFAAVQSLFVHDTIISLARLTDPAGVEPRSNLTVERLVGLLDDPAEASLRMNLEQRLEAARDKLTDVRSIRNRRLAHLDLGTALGRRIELPSGPVVRDVTGALADLKEILNTLERHFGSAVVMYDGYIHQSGPMTLLRRLRMAEAYERHVASGRIGKDEDDLRIPPLDDV